MPRRQISVWGLAPLYLILGGRRINNRRICRGLVVAACPATLQLRWSGAGTASARPWRDQPDQGRLIETRMLRPVHKPELDFFTFCPSLQHALATASIP